MTAEMAISDSLIVDMEIIITLPLSLFSCPTSLSRSAKARENARTAGAGTFEHDQISSMDTIIIGALTCNRNGCVMTVAMAGMVYNRGTSIVVSGTFTSARILYFVALDGSLSSLQVQSTQANNYRSMNRYAARLRLR